MTCFHTWAKSIVGALVVFFSTVQRLRASTMLEGIYQSPSLHVRFMAGLLVGIDRPFCEVV